MLRGSSPDQDNDTNYSPLTTAATLITFLPVWWCWCRCFLQLGIIISLESMVKSSLEFSADRTTVTLDISSLYLQDTDQAAHGSE